jgi:hypothetical protein
MTATLVWTGVALWLGLNAAFSARCIDATRPAKVVAHSARIIHLNRRRA